MKYLNVNFVQKYSSLFSWHRILANYFNFISIIPKRNVFMSNTLEISYFFFITFLVRFATWFFYAWYFILHFFYIFHSTKSDYPSSKGKATQFIFSHEKRWICVSIKKIENVVFTKSIFFQANPNHIWYFSALLFSHSWIHDIIKHIMHSTQPQLTTISFHHSFQLISSQLWACGESIKFYHPVHT
jgi:hypothetical protein